MLAPVHVQQRLLCGYERVSGIDVLLGRVLRCGSWLYPVGVGASPAHRVGIDVELAPVGVQQVLLGGYQGVAFGYLPGCLPVCRLRGDRCGSQQRADKRRGGQHAERFTLYWDGHSRVLPVLGIGTAKAR